MHLLRTQICSYDIDPLIFEFSDEGHLEMVCPVIEHSLVLSDCIEILKALVIMPIST